MPSILSIQSHVAYGYVGNRAAVFPLQRLGVEVHAVNTVQFSNHTGYGDWTGEVFGAGHIREIIDGLARRDVLGATDAVLSGYMGAHELGQVIVDTVARVRAANPDARYCCDPVMGDVGRGFFVRPGIPEFMREVAVPAADIITPNQFELDYLTGLPSATLEQALSASSRVRALGPELVLVTSLVREQTPPDSIEMLLDSTEGAWLVRTPRLPVEPAPNGAGDCTSALFLAKILETEDPPAALAHVAAALHALFTATHRSGGRELALIQAQAALVDPPRRFIPEKLR